MFWEEILFYDAIRNAQPFPTFEHEVRGGIVPHHLLASDIIAEFFHQISDQSIKRVILIGPNHYETGRANIITSYYDWETPVGIVRADTTAIQSLLAEASYAGVDEKVAENEHSVSSIMPFIAHYFPFASVVPVIVSMKISTTQLDDLTNALNMLNDDKTILIASVDFSHYLSQGEAEKRDAVTLALLKDSNLDVFLTLNSEYVDSPKSVVLLFKIMSQNGLSKFQVLRHENSGTKIKNEFSEVTSYFTLVFKEN
ncbi:MAG: dioxygenase [Parcubacteria group bacterium Gr01-1014_70]|nr:MAG: dioxygenase [Parcubacteria group bacterium Gr01-1014_70]